MTCHADKAKLSRRNFLKGAAAVTAGLTAGASLSTAEPARPRNVLFIMTDEHHWQYLSAMGHPHALTPNLDRLVRGGVLFENAFCAYPTCTPSRGSLHTGMWPHTHGSNLNVNPPNVMTDIDPELGLPTDTLLMASVFQDAGFRTYHRGKWHIGDERRHPCYREDDHPHPFPRDHHLALRDWLRENPVPSDLPAGSWTEPGDWPVYAIPGMDAFRETGLPYRAGQYSASLETNVTTHITECTLADMADGEAPFMVTWSDPGPHGPHLIQNPYYDAVDPEALELPSNTHRPEVYANDPSCRSYDTMMELMGEGGIREYLRCYCGMIRKIDDQIGRLMAWLEETGQFEDTLIVFTADHGDMCGAHQTAGGKAIWAFYDEIVRVPLIMHWPKGIPAGRRVQTMANGVDVMPTILDYAGLPIPEQCEGRSLRPYIEGEEDLERPAFCEATHPEAIAVRRMIATHDWKLWIHYQGSPDRDTLPEGRPMALYNRKDDPGEEINLADDPAYADVRRDLLRRLWEHMEATNDPWRNRLPTEELAVT